MNLIALAVLTFFSLQQTPVKYTEEQKITYLISVVSKMDAKFVRNGTAYTPMEAADHLRMKRKKAGSRIKTAKDFITVVAAKSSMSGEAYTIKFRDGHVETSEAYLLRQLKVIEK